MSLWSTVEGTVRVPKLNPIGLKEVINSTFYNYDKGRGSNVVEVESAETDYSRLFEFNLTFCDDGVGAAEAVQVLLNNFKTANFDALHVMSTIRFR